MLCLSPTKPTIGRQLRSLPKTLDPLVGIIVPNLPPQSATLPRRLTLGYVLAPHHRTPPPDAHQHSSGDIRTSSRGAAARLGRGFGSFGACNQRVGCARRRRRVEKWTAQVRSGLRSPDGASISTSSSDSRRPSCASSAG